MGRNKLPSHKKDFKKFESNNKSIALNVLFVENDKGEMEQACTFTVNFFKCHFKREKNTILLMIAVKRSSYLPVKNLYFFISSNYIKA